MDKYIIKKSYNKLYIEYIITVKLPSYIMSIVLTTILTLPIAFIQTLSFDCFIVIVCGSIVAQFAKDSIEEYLDSRDLREIGTITFANYCCKRLHKLHKRGKISSIVYEELLDSLT